MKRKLLSKIMLLLCALIVGSGSAWAADVTDTLTQSWTGVSSTSYSSWSNKTSNSGAVYAGNSAGGNSSIQLRSNNNNSGIVTTTSGGKVKSIKVEWHSNTATGRTLNVYGKNSAYSSASDLYNSSKQGTLLGTIVCGTSTELTISGDYEYIGFRSASGAMYLTSVSIVWTSGDTPTTYTVTYDGNGATSGDVPTDDNEYNAENNTVTVLGNGNLEKEHYTFTGWNTVAEGTGTSYDAGSTFTISATTTLFAQWTINTNNVTLPEANQYGTYSMSATNPVAYGSVVTLTYTPAEGYENYQATWSVNGVAIADNKFTMPDEDVSVTVSVKKVLAMTIDFESDASTYSDWTFTNITSKKTDSGVTVHGGTYMGITDGTATAYIQTKEKVSPTSLTCYVSKISTNTTECKWTVQVSSDGDNWEDVSSISASSMSKGEWKKLTADLSTYSDVYVRVYYGSNTAKRCIDDLTLILQDSEKPNISADNVEIAYEATRNSIIYTINNYVEGTMTASSEADWIYGLNSEDDNYNADTNEGIAYFSAAANTGDERTATITLTFTYGENQTVTKNVTITQAGDPNQPGTQNNPYTVAQARAAIDAGTGVTGVYATGIVSEIVTAYSSQYYNITYNISEDGSTTADQLQAYRGKSYNGDNFTSEDDIQVGDIVVIYGNLKKYSSTYEFEQDNQLVSLLRVVKPETPTFSPEAGTYTSVQNVIISCATEGAVIYYTTDGTDPTTTSNVYSEAIVVNADMTIKAIAIKNDVSSLMATAEYVIDLTPSIVFDGTSNPYNVPCEAGNTNIHYVASNLTGTIQVKLCDAEGEDATYDWFTATLNGDTYVAVEWQANEDTKNARTAYFKLTDGTTTSDIFAITQAKYIPDYAELPFEFNGGRADIGDAAGLSQDGLGTDYGSSPKLKFDSTGASLILKINERPGILTFDIKGNSFSGGTFTVQTSEDGVTYTDLETYTELGDTQSEVFDNLGESVRYIKWVYTKKVSGNVALGNIALKKYVAPAPSITITPDSYIVNADGGDAELPVVIQSLADDPQLEVVFVESDGVTSATYTWISASINSNGNINGHIDENEGAERKAYFIVNGLDADANIVSSNLVTITQAAPTEPSITMNTSSVDIVFEGEQRTIGFGYESLGSNPKFTVRCYEADGTTLTTYDWLTAEINPDKKVEITVSPNNGDARTAYLRVYGESENGTRLALSDLVTISQAKFVVDYATLPFNWEGGASADFKKLNGVTTNGLGSDYAASNAPYNIKFDSDDDYIQIKTDGQPLKVTMDVKMLGGANTSTITVQGSADGENFTDVQKLTISGSQNDVLNFETSNSFASNDRYVRLYFKKGSNVGVGAITINLVKKSISAAGYATFCSTGALDFTSVSGLTAYKATISGFDVSFDAITKVPAGQGVLLKGAKGTYNIPVIASADAIDNAFIGVTEPTQVDSEIFVLMNGEDGVGFYRTKGAFTVGAHTAYLPASAGTRSFIGFDGEGTTTSINEGLSIKNEDSTAVYNLSGQRVAKPAKGLYIVNGKKVVMK